MIDAQLDMFGGETLVTRKRNRPAPAADPAVQMALFATDAGELDGQSAATDLFGALVAGEVIHMVGDILHDATGWFFRDNGDGTYDNLSADGAPRVDASALRGAPIVLVRNGTPTGDGDPLAARVAVVLARRYVAKEHAL